MERGVGLKIEALSRWGLFRSWLCRERAVAIIGMPGDTPRHWLGSRRFRAIAEIGLVGAVAILDIATSIYGEERGGVGVAAANPASPSSLDNPFMLPDLLRHIGPSVFESEDGGEHARDSGAPGQATAGNSKARPYDALDWQVADLILLKVPGPPPAGRRKGAMSKPAAPALVSRTQATLAELGYDPGPVDGIEGQRTKAAVRAYQFSEGLDVSGRVTKSLMAHLTDADRLRASSTDIEQADDVEQSAGRLSARSSNKTAAPQRDRWMEFDPTAASWRAGAGHILATLASVPGAVRWFANAALNGGDAEPPSDSDGNRPPGPAFSDRQEPSAPRPARKKPSVNRHDTKRIADPFLKELASRDRAIAQLLRRLETLERRVDEAEGTSGANGIKTSQAPARPSVPSGGPNGPSSQTAADNEVRGEDSLRALERTLVEEGGLVLREGAVQVTPGIAYNHRRSNGLRIINLGGLPVIAEQDVRVDTLESSLTLRAGLPWESQAEIFVPFVYRREKIVLGGTLEEDRTGTAFGDVEVALTKQVLREQMWIPDLLAGIRWKSTSGTAEFDPSSDDVSTGTGFNGLTGSVTAVKSKDPLVFFGGGTYTHNFSAEKEGNDIDPGNALGFSVGTILAASPDTSLRLVYRHEFTEESEIEGIEVPGSDRVEGIFEVGGSVVLTPSVLLDVAVGIGVTDDAPDVRFNLSLPFRY